MSVILIASLWDVPFKNLVILIVASWASLRSQEILQGIMLRSKVQDDCLESLWVCATKSGDPSREKAPKEQSV